MQVKILAKSFCQGVDKKEHLIYISKFITYNHDNRNCRIETYTDIDEKRVLELNNLELSNLQDVLNEMM